MRRKTSNGAVLAEGPTGSDPAEQVSREQLIFLLNEDLARAYQAIIANVTAAQSLKGAEYMAIAADLDRDAEEELRHARTLARQIDYLGGEPTVTPMPVLTSPDAKETLLYNLENETKTIHHYRERVRQCEALGEYALAQQIRAILVNEQDHQISLAAALGKNVAELTPNAEEP